jgi:two-component system, chemotaxis family, protein-glutamate methylesterase/glutaminase
LPTRDIIVVGGSAGSVTTFTSLVRALPEDLPVSIFFVTHMRPDSTSTLPLILRRSTTFEAVYPREGERIQCGYIYVAPPNKHMIVEDSVIQLTNGAHENGSRPAIDPLFRSAAQTFGNRVIGVLLSGMLDDGTLGLASIKRHGGITIVEDPDEANFPDMPRSAIDHVGVNYVLSQAALAPLLTELISKPELLPDPRNAEAGVVPVQPPADPQEFLQNAPQYFSCPECGGVLVPHWDGNYIHYVCEVKHTYSPLSLVGRQNEVLERALWSALRGLEEKARLTQQVAKRSQAEGNIEAAERFAEKAREAEQHALVLRRLIFGLE